MARTSPAAKISLYPSAPTEVGHVLIERMGREDGNDRNSGTKPVHIRPNNTRRDTDQILSYYQSEDAGRPEPGDGDSEDDRYTPSGSRYSTASSRSYTPSEYSSDDDADEAVPVPVKQDKSAKGGDTVVAVESAHMRHPSVPSKGSSDRRRLAIAVELDSAAPPSRLPRRTEGIAASKFPRSFGSLQSRRGLHRDLALVAPPDASPKTNPLSTPPPTASISTKRAGETETSRHIIPRKSAFAIAHSDTQQYLRHKSSRDIGIVGTTAMTSILGRNTASSGGRRTAEPETLRPPVFQTPHKSRSPSPAVQTPELSDSVTSVNEPYQTTPGSHAHFLTPSNDEGKIKHSVHGPVGVNDASDEVIHRQTPTYFPVNPPPSVLGPRGHPVSPYLFYEPGVHATAGPLPPPPKSIFESDNQATLPPPRPPRLRTPFGTPATSTMPDIQALKESLRLPKSVSQKLTSRSNSQVDITATQNESPRAASEYDRISTHTDEAEDIKRSASTHKREGAFPPSSASTSVADSPAPVNALPRLVVATQDSLWRAAQVNDRNLTRRSFDSPSLVVASPDGDSDNESSKMSYSAPLKHQTSWVSIREGRDSAPQGRPAVSRQNTSDSHSFETRSPPIPPLKPLKSEQGRLSSGSSNPFRNTLTNLKRFSALPRTPSQLSMATSSQSHRTRTPSPSHFSLPPPPKRQPLQKIKALWPTALQYDDVLAKTTSLERSKAYAHKINELAQFECGLTDWIIATKYRGSGWRGGHSSNRSVHASPRAPSSFNLNPQLRHTSHGSMGSEATFPLRSDAYTATDLSMRETDDVSSTKSPPTLPYPSLANPRVSNRSSMLTISSQRYEMPLSTGSGKGSGTGFFASFGRKTSVKKDRSLMLSPTSPHRVLTKRVPDATRSPPPPRPVQLSAQPSVPGGPRTVPTRMQRAQTISASPSPPSLPAPTATSASTELSRRNTQRSSVDRRPSLFSRSASVVPGASSGPIVSDPHFEDQVDKLADLLPHADRQILAGYLRRSGQDILAIGQYLEDEKNGILRRD